MLRHSARPRYHPYGPFSQRGVFSLPVRQSSGLRAMLSASISRRAKTLAQRTSAAMEMMMQIDETAPEVARELCEARGNAEGQLRHEHAGHMLNPTALVHEAHLDVIKDGSNYGTRLSSLALTARMTRRILVDFVRRRKAGKRGGEWSRTTLRQNRARRRPIPRSCSRWMRPSSSSIRSSGRSSNPASRG